MGRLAAKQALITGAGSGIGRSIALLFAREGAQVAVLDRERAWAEGTCREIEREGGSGLPLVADVSQAHEVDRALREVENQFGGLQVLVNNAGILLRRSFEQLDEKEWDRVLATNLKGAILCTRRALPLLKAQRGSKIINLASIMVAHHARGLSAYSASKGALASLSRSLALELAKHSIAVNYICPGFIRTEMTQPLYSRWLLRKYVERRTPFRRLGEPEDVARVALFLASSDSDFVTGQGITVDGGFTLMAL